MKKAIAIALAALLVSAASLWARPAPMLIAGHGDIEALGAGRG